MNMMGDVSTIEAGGNRSVSISPVDSAVGSAAGQDVILWVHSTEPIGLIIQESIA